ncbi:MAG: hypothetical protein HY322_16010 [Betaproteobacteria bacterium]|nr:hypothetical protein [Betaproteobacteria bacterium]
MAIPWIVGLGDWNEMVGLFHSETDRGAAILAGSFAEHALGTFLTHRVKDKNVAEKLFGPVGPLSSFSQRIAVAYAFDLISPTQYKDFESIRQARNHFAHHPLEASFGAPEVQKHTSRLAIFKDPSVLIHADPATEHRIAYLLA